MMHRRLIAVLSVLARTAVAEADDSAMRWEPGERVTARVEPEVTTDDDLTDRGGVYGRFDGNLDIGLHAGAELGEQRARGAFLLTLHHFYTAGPYVSYVDRFGGDGAIDARTLGVGVDLRPTFLPRWSENRQHGSSFLDLTIDSIAVGLGGFWSEPTEGSFGDRRGLETSLRLAVPLLGRPSGPWIGARGVLRFPDPARQGGRGRGEAVAVAIAWQTLVDAPW